MRNFTLYGVIRGCLCLTLKVPALLMLLPVTVVMLVPVLFVHIIECRDWEEYKGKARASVSSVRDLVLWLLERP